MEVAVAFLQLSVHADLVLTEVAVEAEVEEAAAVDLAEEEAWAEVEDGARTKAHNQEKTSESHAGTWLDYQNLKRISMLSILVFKLEHM